MTKGGRTLAVATVLLILGVTLAPPLQRYFTQRAQINALSAQLHDSQATLKKAALSLAQWNDPAYVAAQARSRLHYVYPGERQYIVLGAPDSVTKDPNAPAAPIAGNIPAGIPWYSKVIASITATNQSP
ncbi:MAG: septum formation initiator family protein [Actinomycetes bacterium]|jgi:cell division protein FtsB